MKKLAIVTTHPIQYNAPWFQLLAQRKNISIKVFYTWSQSKTSVADATFGKEISWDIPVLEGYDYEFVENTAKDPGVHHFFGINCPQLIDRITDYKPDAVLVFGWNFISHIKVLRHFKKKIPVWFRGDSTLLNETLGLKTKMRRMVLSWVYKHVDKALHVGNANKAYFLKHGLTEKQLVYVPHAIDNARFSDDGLKRYQNKAEQWRKQLGYTQNDIVVLYAGKFEPNKQIDLLLDGLIKVNAQRKNKIKLLLLGNGPLEFDLKEKAKPYNFVTFIPFQNQTQMPIVYRLGDVFCLPSVSETWGLAINEAMASGSSVIVSNRVGCAKDLIKQGENGWVFKYDNENEFVELLSSLTKEKLQITGFKAEQSIQDWSFEAIVLTIELLLNDK